MPKRLMQIVGGLALISVGVALVIWAFTVEIAWLGFLFGTVILGILVCIFAFPFLFLPLGLLMAFARPFLFMGVEMLMKGLNGDDPLLASTKKGLTEAELRNREIEDLEELKRLVRELDGVVFPSERTTIRLDKDDR